MKTKANLSNEERRALLLAGINTVSFWCVMDEKRMPIAMFNKDHFDADEIIATKDQMAIKMKIKLLLDVFDLVLKR